MNYRLIRRPSLVIPLTESPNAWGEIVSVDENGKELPVICGHGGSQWYCRKCAEDGLKWQESEDQMQACGGGI